MFKPGRVSSGRCEKSRKVNKQAPGRTTTRAPHVTRGCHIRKNRNTELRQSPNCLIANNYCNFFHVFQLIKHINVCVNEKYDSN